MGWLILLDFPIKNRDYLPSMKTTRPKTPVLLILFLCCLPACALVVLALNLPERQPKPKRYSVRPPLPTYDPKLLEALSKPIKQIEPLNPKWREVLSAKLPEIKPIEPIQFAPAPRSPVAETARIPEPIYTPMPAPRSYAPPTPRPDPRISVLERRLADLEREQEQRDLEDARQEMIDNMDEQRRQLQQRYDRDFRRRSQ
jgi:hypothetical protein